jgi:hypothetical protein
MDVERARLRSRSLSFSLPRAPWQGDQNFMIFFFLVTGALNASSPALSESACVFFCVWVCAPADFPFRLISYDAFPESSSEGEGGREGGREKE